MDDYKIIAVDFYGTLCYSNWPDLGEPNVRLIEYLKRFRKTGNNEYSRAAEPPVRFGESQSTGSSEPPGILCRERLFTRVGI